MVGFAVAPNQKCKKMKKRGNWSEFHFSEVTSYKIHTLGLILYNNKSLYFLDRIMTTDVALFRKIFVSYLGNIWKIGTNIWKIETNIYQHGISPTFEKSFKISKLGPWLCSPWKFFRLLLIVEHLASHLNRIRWAHRQYFVFPPFFPA